LKRAYSYKVKALIRHYINYISKLKFLLAFKVAFTRVFITSNIYLAFRGVGLIPYEPDVVLLRLDMQLRTPTLPTLVEALWEAQTLSNVRKLKAQSTLIRKRV
jgi:hypothetical protein